MNVKLARPLIGPSHTKTPTHGPDVVAVKRAMARATPDVYPWADFDQVYNARIETAVRSFQAVHAIHPASGKYGNATHAALERAHSRGKPDQWAFDQTAINLMSGEWKVIHPPPDPKVVVQAAMQDYFVRSIKNAANWHYYFNRPMINLGKNPDGVVEADCSAGATGAFYWARMVTGILVPDPNGRGYDNWGNTDWLWSNNSGRRLGTSSTFEVGDMALFTNHSGHVIVCMKGGDWHTSSWWSNGSESAPYPVRVYYRTDLRGIVRPVLVP